MGLLDADDSAIKGTMMYKNAAGAQARIDEALAAFKKKGGTRYVVDDLARACKQALMDIDRASKEHPDFAEYKDMRAKAMEVVKAIVAKFPDSPVLASTKLLDAAKNEAFRY